MHITCFAACTLAGPQLRRAAAWADSLARQQEIYEELLASQELGREWPAWAVAVQRPLSVHEITRNLAGWSPSRAGALGAK